MSTLETNLIQPSTGTSLTLGASGDTITIPSGATITNSGTATGFGGLEMADQFRLSSSLSSMAQDSSTLISANLERVDSDGFGQLGTGMTESSGVFTFPSTGIYFINFHGNALSSGGASAYIVGEIKTTTNNSSYDRAALAYTAADTSNRYVSFDCQFIFDVTDTSTHKVAFYQYKESGNQVQLKGDSNSNETSFTFLKLGAT